MPRAGGVLPQHDRPGRGVHRGRRGRREPHACCRGCTRASRCPPATGSSCSLGAAIGAITFSRLGDRLRQAVGHLQVPPVQGRAGGVQGPAHAQPRARPRDDRSSIVGFMLTEARLDFWLMLALSLRARRADHHPDRRRRHAGGGVDAQQLFGLGGGGHRLLAEQQHADHRRLAGGLLGRDPELHHVQGDEPLVLQRDPGRLRRRDQRPRRPARSSAASRAAAPTMPPSSSATPRP